MNLYGFPLKAQVLPFALCFIDFNTGGDAIADLIGIASGAAFIYLKHQAPKENGYDLVASGVPAMPYYRLDNVDTRTHFKWIDECVRRGVYMLGYHNHFVSTCHTDQDLGAITDIARQAFEALEDNTQ